MLIDELLVISNIFMQFFLYKFRQNVRQITFENFERRDSGRNSSVSLRVLFRHTRVSTLGNTDH